MPDMYAMDAPRFFAFAERLPAYPGVMRERVRQESDRGRPAASRAPRAHGGGGRAGDQVTYYNDITQAPELQQYFGRRRDKPRGKARE